MVCATVCEVGCAIADCPNLATDKYSYYQHFAKDKAGLNVESSDTFLVVCNYSPALAENNLYKIRPYYKGQPCSRCPDEYDECDAGVTGDQQVGPDSGLCCEST